MGQLGSINRDLESQDELVSILRSLDLEDHSWQLYCHGIQTVEDFAKLKSADDLPVFLPEHVKVKVLAHGRSLAILHAARERGKKVPPSSSVPNKCIRDEQYL